MTTSTGVWTEVLEILAALIPAILSLIVGRVSTARVSIWFGKVIGTAILAVLALGLLLMRLTASCSPIELLCTPPTRLDEREPGLFRACQWCVEPGKPGLAEHLNSWALDLQAVAAAVCLLVSSFTVITFMVWARRSLTSQTNSDSQREGS